MAVEDLLSCRLAEADAVLDALLMPGQLDEGERLHLCHARARHAVIVTPFIAGLPWCEERSSSRRRRSM